MPQKKISPLVRALAPLSGIHVDPELNAAHVVTGENPAAGQADALTLARNGSGAFDAAPYSEETPVTIDQLDPDAPTEKSRELIDAIVASQRPKPGLLTAR